jgi:imidazoleglycerol-phosphate dehydratase
MQVRQAQLKRDTKETRIAIKLNLDGSGKSSIKTGIPFFDHMLTLFAKHAVMDLNLVCKGDLVRKRVSSQESVHGRGLRANG